MADFGQTQNAQNGIKMAELGAKMEPRELQDVQDGACLTILRPIGEACLTNLMRLGSYLGHFGNLGGDLSRNS
jgi:hypothetical protein